MTDEEREVAEEFLTNDDIDCIMLGRHGQEYLRDLLLTGMPGYMHFTDDQLQDEINERNSMKEYL